MPLGLGIGLGLDHQSCFAPGILPSPRFYADAQQDALSDGTAVASWTNRFGGNPGLQATGANQPAFHTNQINGHPALVWNGSSTYLDAAIALTGTVLTAYFVAVIDTYTLSDRLGSVIGSGATGDYDNAASGILGTVTNAGSRAVATFRNNAQGGAIACPTTGTPFVWTAVYDGTNQYARLNGVAGSTAASTGSFNVAVLRLGAGEFGGGVTNILHGKIGAVALYAAAHSTPQMQQMERYLGARWSVSTS